MKTEHIGIRATTEEKRSVMEHAKNCHRTVSNYLLWLHKKSKNQRYWSKGGRK